MEFFKELLGKQVLVRYESCIIGTLLEVSSVGIVVSDYIVKYSKWQNECALKPSKRSLFIGFAVISDMCEYIDPTPKMPAGVL